MHCLEVPHQFWTVNSSLEAMKLLHSFNVFSKVWAGSDFLASWSKYVWHNQKQPKLKSLCMKASCATEMSEKGINCEIRKKYRQLYVIKLIRSSVRYYLLPKIMSLFWQHSSDISWIFTLLFLFPSILLRSWLGWYVSYSLLNTVRT